jgi:hypothetical protein
VEPCPDVQSASYDRNTFTINVGLMVPELYELVHGRKPASFVEEPECVVRERIGCCSSGSPPIGGSDKWWELASETDELNYERELGDILPERVLPFLRNSRAFRMCSGIWNNRTDFSGRSSLGGCSWRPPGIG